MASVYGGMTLERKTRIWEIWQRGGYYTHLEVLPCSLAAILKISREFSRNGGLNRYRASIAEKASLKWPVKGKVAQDLLAYWK